MTGTQVFDSVLHVYVDKPIIFGNSGALLLSEDVRVVGMMQRGVAASEEADVRVSSAVAICHFAETRNQLVLHLAELGASGRLKIPGDTESANDLLVRLEARLAEASSPW